MPLHGLVHGRRDSLKGSGSGWEPLNQVLKLSADGFAQALDPPQKSSGRILLEETKMTRPLWSQNRTMVSGVRLRRIAVQLTSSSGSPLTHHIAAAPWCRSIENYPAHIHPRRTIYAGKNHKVRATIFGGTERERLTRHTALWHTQILYYPCRPLK